MKAILEILKILIMINFIFPSGYFSNGYEKSINYSFSTLVDNETYYDYLDSENFDIIELKPKLYNGVVNIVLKGKYELGLEYAYNTSFINGYNLPYRGSYNYFYFKYHFKEREKFPLNLSFNIKYGEAASFRSNNDYIFNSKSAGISFYKELSLSLSNYPIIPVFSFDKFCTYTNDLLIEEYHMVSINLLLKLIVNNIDNDTMRDIIWLGPKVSIVGDDQRLGFSFGLYHPIK